MSALARGMRLTPFMVSLTAYAGLLGRLTGADRLLVGTPLSGRVHPELEPLIGFFVNALPVRADLSGDPTFADLLARIRTSLLDVLSHQHVPFEVIVDALALDRSPSHTPLMQTMFTYEGRPLAEPRLQGVKSELLTLRAKTAKFDLDFMIVQAADGSGDLEVAINYATDLFDDSTIERLAGRFHRFLAAAVAMPDSPLRSLPLLGEDERDAIVERWSATAAARDDNVLLDELFAMRVTATPEAPAVSLGAEVLSYAELDARAERLARRLRSAGVGPDDVIGLLLPRGVQLVTAVLGIVKSGGAYLPLDPSHPAGHIARVLATAGSEIVVTDADGTQRLRGTGVEALGVDACDEDEHGALAPSPRPHPDNLAYVIFTSGSTGEPKGVGVPHRALVNHAQAIRDRFDLRPSDRVLQFANIAFDVAAEEIFPTWLAGGCVVLCDAAPTPQDLLAFMADAGVTVANLPSSYWQQWAAMLERDGELSGVALRLLVVGSESVDAEALENWRCRTTVRVLNAYGLTETAITAVVHAVDEPVADVTVPIGRPIDGVEAYVLDSDLQLVPLGVQGELYIGGAGLARGYLQRPDLTAERFVPHPFSAVPGARLHRTGDRARWCQDGVIEVLGRVDEQLKVRGHRVEPAEVEAALCSHPEIAQAAVAADGDRLIGYVVECGAGVVSADLRAHVAGRLPAYMVPNVFVALDALPTSASGKLDRRRLPAPGGPTLVPVAPGGSELERKLATIWQRVLGVGQVGLDDNFFDLGGSSFTLATVHAQVCDAVGRRLPMVTLYEHPTIAALARHLGAEAQPATDATTYIHRTPGSVARTASATAAERAVRLRARRARKQQQQQQQQRRTA